MKLFNVVAFIFFVWLAHVLFLFISHGSKGSPHHHYEVGTKHDILHKAREDSKVVEKLLVSFDTLQRDPWLPPQSDTDKSSIESNSQSQQSVVDGTSFQSRQPVSEALEAIQHTLEEQANHSPKGVSSSGQSVIFPIMGESATHTVVEESQDEVSKLEQTGGSVETKNSNPPLKTTSNCVDLYLDDGFGAIPDTSLNLPSLTNNGKARKNTVRIVSGDLCSAKQICQADYRCSGFVWHPPDQRAELVLTALPSPHDWIKNNEVNLSRPFPVFPPLLDDSELPSKKKRKQSKSVDLEARKKELKQMAQVLASRAQMSQVHMPPVLYVKLSYKDTLTQLLKRYDKSPHFQQLISGVAVAPKSEAELRNGINGSIISGSGLPGHPRVEYDVYRTAGEWWAEFVKGQTIDGGICAVKAACAADPDCDGFIYRVRDGAGLLGKTFKILEAKSPNMKNKLPKFERKTPRGVMLYVKRPRNVAIGNNNFVGTRKVGKPLSRSSQSSVTGDVATSTCWDITNTVGTPPRSDMARRDLDPEVALLRKARGLISAYRSDVSDSIVKAVSQRSPFSLRTPPPPPPTNKVNNRVWISLTTLPGRIHQIQRIIESLLVQTLPADEIVISVPEHSDREAMEYPIPDWLQEMTLRVDLPKVRIRRIEHDFGPATKLIPSVIEAQELNENVLIMVVDDDTLYSPRLLETFLQWHQRLPDAALAFSGWPVTLKTLKYPHWSENYLVYGNEVFAPHPVSVIRGNCGYMVQSRFFDDFLWKGYTHAPPGAFYMDDVWISGNLAKKQVNRFVVPFDEDQFTMTPNLENVTTLDHVELTKPSAHTLRLKGEDTNTTTSSQDKRPTSKGGKGPPSNRIQANEQALRYFKNYWDVYWNSNTYKIVGPDGS